MTRMASNQQPVPSGGRAGSLPLRHAIASARRVENKCKLTAISAGVCAASSSSSRALRVLGRGFDFLLFGCLDGCVGIFNSVPGTQETGKAALRHIVGGGFTMLRNAHATHTGLTIPQTGGCCTRPHGRATPIVKPIQTDTTLQNADKSRGTRNENL